MGVVQDGAAEGVRITTLLVAHVPKQEKRENRLHTVYDMLACTHKHQNAQHVSEIDGWCTVSDLAGGVAALIELLGLLDDGAAGEAERGGDAVVHARLLQTNVQREVQRMLGRNPLHEMSSVYLQGVLAADLGADLLVDDAAAAERSAQDELDAVQSAAALSELLDHLAVLVARADGGAKA